MAAKSNTKTTNEKIVATLRTKVGKPAKYAEDLRALGYEVTDFKNSGGITYDRDRWAVNGLEIDQCDDGLYLFLRVGYVKGLRAIARVDFENYFATLEERTERAKRRSARGNIWQVLNRNTYRERECVNPSARFWDREYRAVKRHRTLVSEGNQTIDRYLRLRDKASGGDRYWGRNDIERAERAVDEAEAKVQEALSAVWHLEEFARQLAAIDAEGR